MPSLSPLALLSAMIAVLYQSQLLPNSSSLSAMKLAYFPSTFMSSVPTSYKASVYESYGKAEDVIKTTNVATEPLPASHVRIQVHSAAINPIDWKLIEIFGEYVTGGSPSVDKPYRLGFDVAGVVAEVGGDVKDFQVGDEVFAMAPMTAFGTIAQYVAVDAQYLAIKPKSVTFDQAASVPLVSLTAYQALKEHAKIQAGETVLILGGTTSTGLVGIQYAKTIGARVIATTSSKNVAFVKSLGADVVIDYTSQKWADILDPHSVDVVFDNAVESTSWENEAQTILRKDTGRFVTLDPSNPPGPSKFGAVHSAVSSHPSGEQLTAVAKLIDEGKIKPVIDSTYTFENVVKAFSRSKTGRAVGKIVIKMVK